LYHLLPVRELRRVGLPLLKRGLWPHLLHQHHAYGYLSEDFDRRLADAFSHYIWPLLNARTSRAAFTRAEPIRILSQHLDFWLPYIDVVAQRRASTFGRVPIDVDDEPELLARNIGEWNQQHVESGAQLHRPMRG